MVSISPDAVAKVEQLIASSGPTDWFLVISWRKGAANNRRTTDGAVSWDIEPDEGWVVELGGWNPGKVPRNEGTPICGEVRLLVQNQLAPSPFPGGEIYLSGGDLTVRAHAI